MQANAVSRTHRKTVATSSYFNVSYVSVLLNMLILNIQSLMQNCRNYVLMYDIVNIVLYQEC